MDERTLIRNAYVHRTDKLGAEILMAPDPDSEQNMLVLTYTFPGYEQTEGTYHLTLRTAEGKDFPLATFVSLEAVVRFCTMLPSAIAGELAITPTMWGRLTRDVAKNFIEWRRK